MSADPTSVAGAGRVLHGLALHALVRVLPLPAAARPALTAGHDTLRSASRPDPEAERSAPPVDRYADGFREGREAGASAMVEETRRQAREEGFQRGFEDGRQQGNEEAQLALQREAEAGQQALRERAEQLEGWLAAIPAQLDRLLAAQLAASEDDMVALAHAAICRLLGAHALALPVVAGAVRQAITECCGGGADGAARTLVSVRVHPADLAGLEADTALAEWLVRQGAQGVRWRPDPGITLGGCVVESTQGRLDARLDTQLAALQALLGAQRSVPGSAALQASEAGL